MPLGCSKRRPHREQLSSIVKGLLGRLQGAKVWVVLALQPSFRLCSKYPGPIADRCQKRTLHRGLLSR